MSDEHDQPGSLKDDADYIRQLTVRLTETTTVLRRFVAAQEASNRLAEANRADHDKRLQELEKWRAVLEAVLPKEWLNPEQVERQIDELKRGLTTTRDDVKRLMVIVAGAAAAVQIFGPPLFKFALAYLTGSH
jgi:chromosome segregation ATPase